MLLRSLQNTLKDELTNAGLEEYLISFATARNIYCRVEACWIVVVVVTSLRSLIAGRAVSILMAAGPAKGTLRDSRVSRCNVMHNKGKQWIDGCQPPPFYVQEQEPADSVFADCVGRRRVLRAEVVGMDLEASLDHQPTNQTVRDRRVRARETLCWGRNSVWGVGTMKFERVQRTNASTNGRRECNTHGDAGCLASVEKRVRSRRRCCRILCSARQQAGRS